MSKPSLHFHTMYSRLNSPTHFHACSGSNVRDEYALGFDDDGCQCLECIGQTDLYAQIQSHREACDLSLMLSRLDPSKVNSMMSTYSFMDLLTSDIVDLTRLPRNPGALLNLMKKGENMFNGLPHEVREAFNFSVEKFTSQFGSRDFRDKIDFLNNKLYPKSVEKPIVDTPKGDDL